MLYSNRSHCPNTNLIFRQRERGSERTQALPRPGRPCCQSRPKIRGDFERLGRFVPVDRRLLAGQKLGRDLEELDDALGGGTEGYTLQDTETSALKTSGHETILSPDLRLRRPDGSSVDVGIELATVLAVIVVDDDHARSQLGDFVDEEPLNPEVLMHTCQHGVLLAKAF